MDASRILNRPELEQSVIEARAGLSESEFSLFNKALIFVVSGSDVDTFSAPGFRNDPTALEIHFARGVAKGVAQALIETRGDQNV